MIKYSGTSVVTVGTGNNDNSEVIQYIAGRTNRFFEATFPILKRLLRTFSGLVVVVSSVCSVPLTPNIVKKFCFVLFLDHSHWIWDDLARSKSRI